MDARLYRLLGLPRPTRLCAAYVWTWERHILLLTIGPALGLLLSAAAGDFGIIRPVVAAVLFALCFLLLGACGIYGDRWYRAALSSGSRTLETRVLPPVREKSLDVLNKQEI